MARMRRGKRREVNRQCDICNRITAGPQKGQHPDHQVNAADERGYYRTQKDAEAAGVDYQANGVSHGSKSCPYCGARLKAIENESRKFRGDDAVRYKQQERQKLLDETARYRAGDEEARRRLMEGEQ